MVTGKDDLIHNSTMLQFTFRLISKDENNKRKTADAPMSLSARPTNLLIYSFFIYFCVGGDEYNRHSLLDQTTLQQTFITSGWRWVRKTQNRAEIWEPFRVMTDEVT